MKKDVLCCPRCKRLVQPKDFLANTAIVAVLESLPQTIDCGCGYRGMPIKMTLKDYARWRGEPGS